MKAVQFSEYGGPEVLHVVEVDEPIALRTSTVPFASVVVASVVAKVDVGAVEVVTCATAPHSTLSIMPRRGTELVLI